MTFRILGNPDRNQYWGLAQKSPPRAPTRVVECEVHLIKAWYAHVLRCPYCGEEEILWVCEKQGNPLRFLGDRIPRCRWSDIAHVRLVAIEGEITSEELNVSFPLVIAPAMRVPIPRRLRAQVWDKTGGRCWYCGTQTHPFDDFCVDHVVPVRSGGKNDLANLVPACFPCNATKSGRSVEEFRAVAPWGSDFWFECQDRAP